MNKLFFPLIFLTAATASLEAYYEYPGDVIGEQGADQLLNLGKSIPFSVNLIFPNPEDSPVNKASIEELVSKVWGEFGMDTKAPGAGKHRFFNLTVLVYTEQDNFVAVIQGKLFEEVQLRRIQLNKDHIFQAITWEQTKMLLSPKAKFPTLLNETVTAMTTDFAKRLEAFRRLEREKS